jgi:hypothetical protein|tara:strand:+ start:464 stop:724 length:261 start_codon:yes stop_codon:yes gene_type:complete
MKNNKPIEINSECKFLEDLENNSKMALYNLTIAVGQVYLVTKGIKPSRHFKITRLKNYFGMNGGPEVFHSKLVKLQEVINKGVKNG